MAKFLRHGPCDDCGSSDARAFYDDGSSHCFSCKANRQHNEAVEEEEELEDEEEATTVETSREATQLLNNGSLIALPDRRITKETCTAFGVRVVTSGTEGAKHLYPLYRGSQLVAVKVRRVDTKQFTTVGDQKVADMFGMSRFSKGGRFITVCEGELDAMAAWQMMGGKGPCVSPRNGTGSVLADVKRCYEWLDSFETVVFVPDADKPGRKAAEQAAELFAPGKVKVVELAEGKDPCDYLKAGQEAKFVKRWWNAKVFTPAGLVNGADLYERLRDRPRPECFPYPWEGLNRMTYGMRDREMVTLIAGSGMGKTQVCREIVYHRLKTTDHGVGCVLLEESVEDSGLGLMSLAAGKLLHLPDTVYTTEEFDRAYAETLKDRRVTLLDDAFGSMDITTIVQKVRYFCKVLGCRLVVLDHISIVVSDQRNTDERRALDEIATKLKTVCMETGAQLLIVSHTKRQAGKPHEEGGSTSLADIRGTAGIGQLSNIVLGLERDGQHADHRVRNTTLVRVLKNRFSGKTGPASYLEWDDDTGRLHEVEDPASELENEVKAAPDATATDV